MNELKTIIRQGSIKSFSEPEITKINEELASLEALGARKKYCRKLRLRLWLHEKSKEWFMIRQPHWMRSGSEPFYLRYPHIPLEIKGFIRKKLQKAILNIPIAKYDGVIPSIILKRATQALETREKPPKYLTIWAVVDNIPKQQLILCPLLIGYWVTPYRFLGNIDTGVTMSYCSHETYCTVLGMWGKDLEEIDLAVVGGK